MHRLLAPVLLLTASLLGWSGSAGAAKVSLSPIKLTMNAQDQKATSILIKNADQVPVEFTAEVYRWTQQGGKEVLEPTRDVLLNPARVVVAPGRGQLVRFALRVPSRVPEQTYRVILRQVLTPALQAQAASAQAGAGQAASSQVSLIPLFQFSVPLFVSGAPGQARPQVVAERTAAGLRLNFSNAGTLHTVYRNLELRTGERKIGLSTVYVLPGATMSVDVPGSADLAGPFELTYLDTDLKERRETVAAPQR